MKKYMSLCACVALSSFILGCSNDPASDKVKGRFEVVSQFPLLDGKQARWNTGEIWIDRETGKCYLYVWGGAASGGPAITEFGCE